MTFADTIETSFKTLQSTSGVTIKYSRGDRNITLTAIPSETDFLQSTGDGYMETIESRDFMFPASQLNLGGEMVLPERGDTITETVNGVEHTYPVTNPGGARYYKYSDPYRKILRVHTKWTK